MKKVLFLLIICIFSLQMKAQDSKAFKGHLCNNVFKVYLDIDFYANNIIVPGQEIFGELPGYFGALRDSRKWLITSVKLTDPTTAILSITNDYGSEDLEAILKLQKDGSYVLQQKKGSRIKIVVDRKWVKIPTDLVLVKSNREGRER